MVSPLDVYTVVAVAAVGKDNVIVIVILAPHRLALTPEISIYTFML
jgi:hypothetical protein